MKNKRYQDDERGFLLVVTMIILVVLTIVGMTALDNSIFESKIASNDRMTKVAFNIADGSVYSTSKLISLAMTDTMDPDYAVVEYEDFVTIEKNFTVTNAPNAFYRRAMGYDVTQTAAAINPLLPDLQIKPKGPTGNVPTVEVYLVARSAKMIAGGGAEFGSGAAGAGVGSGGAGAAITIDVDIDGFSGTTSRAAKSTVSARFRKVLGASGGL